MIHNAPVSAASPAGTGRCRNAAVAYASLGWPTFPCRPAGKAPLTKHGRNDATVDLDQVNAWWDRWPDANVAIATGPPGPTVVDCDGPVGRRSWQELVGTWSAPWSITGGGGWHVFYAGDETIRNRVGWLDKVDLRGVGGYVIAPPSVHETGNVYRWERAPVDLLPNLPIGIRDLLAVEDRPRPAVVIPWNLSSVGGGYGTAALEGECERVAGAAAGTRNDTLVRSAFRIGQLVAAGRVDPAAAVDELLRAAVAAGLPVSEASKTVLSGLKAGATRPRSVR